MGEVSQRSDSQLLIKIGEMLFHLQITIKLIQILVLLFRTFVQDKLKSHVYYKKK